jgi:hypothetical protein
VKITHAPTDAFGDVFRRLVRCFQPRGLDRGSLDAYRAALATKFPLDVLRESAERMTVARKFFPTVAEWTAAARSVQQLRGGGCTLSDCARCGGRGLVRVDYETGEPFDLAICRCEAGKPYRRGGAALVRMRFALDDTHYVAPIEDFEGEV